MTTDQNKSPPIQQAIKALKQGIAAKSDGFKHQKLCEALDALNKEHANEDLLEACETALKDYQQHIPSAETVPNILRAAIAKARGQQWPA